MKELLDKIVNILREQLNQYGELLLILQEQQQAIMIRDADRLINCVERIQAKVFDLQNIRQSLEQIIKEASVGMSVKDEISLQLICESIPEDIKEYRILIQSLVEENNRLMSKVREIVRQNHILLARSLELTEKFLGLILSHSMPVGYNGIFRGSSLTDRVLHP